MERVFIINELRTNTCQFMISIGLFCDKLREKAREKSSSMG